jgi:hypothetical protein
MKVTNKMETEREREGGREGGREGERERGREGERERTCCPNDVGDFPVERLRIFRVATIISLATQAARSTSTHLHCDDRRRWVL